MFCPVLEFREKKWTFVKVERGDVDFFQQSIDSRAAAPRQPSVQDASDAHEPGDETASLPGPPFAP
jgi:hypothetical protein